MNFRPSSIYFFLALALFLACSHAEAADPEIVGSSQFSNQVHQALLLLRSRDTNAYAIVTNYVGRIQQGERSGMWAYNTPPTYVMADPTTFVSVTWCAATIAHDSFHSKLYHDYLKTHRGDVPANVWTGIEAEKQCMKHQLLVMERIGASNGRLITQRHKRMLLTQRTMRLGRSIITKQNGDT